MKTNTNKFYLILALLLIFVFAFTGCKKTDDAKETKSNDTQTQENTEKSGSDAANTATATPAPTAAPVGYKMVNGTVDIKSEAVVEENYEDGKTVFTGRGSAKIQIANDQAAEGSKSMLVTGRTSSWNGATVDLSDKVAEGDTYHVKAKVMYKDGPDNLTFNCMLEKDKNKYITITTLSANKGIWTDIDGSIVIPQGTQTASIYFETGYSGPENVDFYVDNVTITKEIATVNRGDIPVLKDVWKDNFIVGVAATASELLPANQELIKEQFNSLTPGNELKPDSVLDYTTCKSDPKYDDNPAVNFDKVKPIFEYAKAAGLKMRGHTLVWHSQTPRWFFTVGYSMDQNAPLVSKDLMLKRMENYIRQVIEYAQTNYPGMIYAWDVVNEAIEPADSQKDGYRSKDSLWYQVIGPEFVEKAFEYARKYADKGVKLIYNDYNTEDPGKATYIYNLAKNLKDKGLIDGIGLQSHITETTPSLINMQNTMTMYGKLGLELQITELDMGMTDNSDEALLKQAKRYKRIFTTLKNMDDSGLINLTSVTFWGLSDDISWLNKPGQPSYPLLFDKYLLQKPAFWGVVLSPDIPIY